jgi:thioredoxin reductase
MTGNIWDVIIIGGGPAGSSAAMVLARSRRNVLIIDEGKQRNLKSHGLHNFLTRDGILPPDFLNLAHTELKHYKVRIKKTRVVDAERSDNDHFLLRDEKGQEYRSRKLLLATGVVDIIPDIPGMKELWGCSVFHCPFCDGFECKERRIGLYARIHNGYGMALALRHLSGNVTLYTDGIHYLRSGQRKQLQNRNIEIVTKKIARLIPENNNLSAIELADGTLHPCDSLFVHHAIHINQELSLKLGCATTRKGATITNRRQLSSVNGVYVAGDAAIDMHFVVVAAAEGVKAGVAIHDDLLREDNHEALKESDKVKAAGL